jgi:hypothetical protein
MNTWNRVSALLVSLFLAAPRPAAAQSVCARQLGAIQRPLQAFERDAGPMGPGFLRTDGVPGSREGLVALAERVKRWTDGIDGYRTCLKREGCSIGTFIKGEEASDRDLARWLSSLADEGLDQATRRAERAAAILRDFTLAAGSATTGPMAAAITCLGATPPAAPAAAPRESPALQVPGIDHQPVACAVAEKFPRMEARFSPRDAVAKAQVLFQGASAEWYAVAMQAEGEGFSGVLPKPRRSLKEFHYYIEVTDRTQRTSRTADYTASVVASASECKGKVVAGTLTAAAVVVLGPAGAGVVPAGFAATGVVAAGSGAAGASSAGAGGAGGLGTGVMVAGGLAAAAGGIAVAAAASKSGDSGSGSTGTSAASCPSAAELASTSGGTLTPSGTAVCTQFLPCTSGSARVCVQNWCSTTSCTIYYQTTSGAQTLCSTGCSSTNTSGIQPCVNSFVSRICQ